MVEPALDLARQALKVMDSYDEEHAAELFHPDAEWHNTSVFPGERVWRGPDGILAFWRTLGEDFDEAGRVIEHEAVRGSRAILGLRSWGRGRVSGAAVDVHWGAVFHVRDGRIARVDVYGSYERALESVDGA